MAKSKRSTGGPGLRDERGSTGSPREPDVIFDAPAAPQPMKEEDTKTGIDASGDGDLEPLAPKKDAPPAVQLRVFQATSGLRAEVFAGFASYVRRSKLSACPLSEWRSRYDAFLKKPTR